VDEVPVSTAGVVDTGVEVGASAPGGPPAGAPASPLDEGLSAALAVVGGDGKGMSGVSVGDVTGAGAVTAGGTPESAGAVAGAGCVPWDVSSRSLMCFSATARLGAAGASFRNRR
jgi:hypothetical protein